jgi:monomeric isocitrate dehydrogenase
MDKQILQDRQQKIIELIRDFCTKHLNEEYFELCERLVKKLGRKRNPPIATGQPNIWAATIIHAIGSINFLFDKSSKPYVSVEELNSFFGTSNSTIGNKSKQIRDMLKLKRWDNEFSTKAMQDNNPFADMVMVDGFIVSIKTLPEKYQKAVRQARAEGKDISFNTR